MMVDAYEDTVINLYESSDELINNTDLEVDGNVRRWRQILESLNTAGHSTSRKWIGFSSYNDFLHKLEHGWPEAIEKVKELGLKELPLIKTKRRRKKKADFGEEIDMQAVYSGDLDTAWSSFERVDAELTGFNNVTILVNMSTSCHVRASNSFWKGAAASILTRDLTLMGKNVEIIAMKSCYSFAQRSSNIHRCVVLIPVKKFEYLMEEELVYATLSPGFARSHMFKGIIKAADSVDRIVADNLGYPEKPREEVLSKALPGRKLVYVPHSIEAKESCERFINSTIEQLNLERGG